MYNVKTKFLLKDNVNINYWNFTMNHLTTPKLSVNQTTIFKTRMYANLIFMWTLLLVPKIYLLENDTSFYSIFMVSYLSNIYVFNNAL
jgi:hypothetical protein